ncbi:MAG TPA: extracellular solute-binding protein [Firmicutes bacterium]|nr:extracellular solute-binding protein [Bacillota bacterium]
MTKRVFTLVIACLVLAMAFCIPAGARERVKVWYWLDGEREASIIKDAVARFHAKNPGIDVEFVLYPYSDMNQRLLLGFATGSLPDIAWLSSNQVKDFAANEKAVCIQDRFPDDWKKMKQDFYPSWLEFGEYNGKIYAPPIAGSIMGVIVNQDIWKASGLSSYPDSWDDMTKVGKKLTVDRNGDGKMDQYGLLFWGLPYSKYTWALYEYHFLYPNLIIPWSKDGRKATYNSPAAVEALTVMNNWVNVDKITEVGGDIRESFIQKRGAMVLGEAAHIPNYKARCDFALASIHTPTKDGEARGMLGAQNLMMFKSTPAHEEAVWKVMKFLLTDVQFLNDWSIGIGSFSAYKPAMNSERFRKYLNENPASAGLAKAVPNGVARLAYPGFTEISNVLNMKLQEVLLKKNTPKRALDEVQAEVNRILGELYK